MVKDKVLLGKILRARRRLFRLQRISQLINDHSFEARRKIWEHLSKLDDPEIVFNEKFIMDGVRYSMREQFLERCSAFLSTQIRNVSGEELFLRDKAGPR